MPQPTAINKPQIVRATNTGKKVFKDQYANQVYTIQPGETSLIPWEAATLWLGDPTFVNDDARALFPRDDELNRIVIRYGAHEDAEHKVSVAERVAEFRPQLDIQDVDNNPITMLAHDPLGETVVLSHFTPTQQDDILRELDRMRQEQVRLLDALEQMKNDTTAPGLDSARDDTPSKVPGPLG